MFNGHGVEEEEEEGEKKKKSSSAAPLRLRVLLVTRHAPAVNEF